MKKLANMSLDIVDELLQDDMESLLELIQDLPESVKTAHVPSEEETNAMDESEFALVMFHPSFGFMKKYANYNPDLTQLNAKLFIKKEAEIPDEICEVTGKNLYRAMSQYKLEIPEAIAKYASEEYIPNVVDLTTINQVNYAKKLNTVEPEYETVKLSYALPSEEKFPIHDEFHQRKAIEYFDNHSDNLDILSRIEYAKHVKEASREPSEKIEKYANFDIGSYNEDTEIHIKARKRLLKNENHKYIDGLLAKTAEITPLQTCMYLEEIDNTFGLNNLYGRHIEDAPTSCFNQIKVASITSKSGKEVTHKTLEKVVSHEKFASLVSPDLAAALKSSESLAIFEAISKPFQDKLLELPNG